MTSQTARFEWKAHWTLPIAAGLGYATSVIHIYGLGVYIEPISSTFGWSRTTTTFGLTIATLIQALFGVPIGMLVDRIGPRPLGVIGVLLTCGAFAFLGTANGSEMQWYGLWIIMALASLPVQATIWTAAVASRFSASRGMAFAVTLCGASVAAALFPYLGTRLIGSFGWQTAMAVQALIWAVIAFPVILLFFRGAKDEKADSNVKPVNLPAYSEGLTFLEGLRSSIYIRLLIASLLFTFTILAMVVHFVPILTGKGMSSSDAASLAFLIGICSIVGRLGTGFLLDRFHASLVGAIIFLFPIVASILLITLGSTGAAFAAIMIGLTLGAEVDVVVYLTTRHFGLKSFGALYGGLMVALSLGTAIGPLAAAKIFDDFGNYNNFLWLSIGLMLASSLFLATLPRPAFGNPKNN